MSIQREETMQRISRIVIHNDIVYSCGQVGKDSTKGIAEQTETMLQHEPVWRLEWDVLNSRWRFQPSPL